MHPTLNRPTHTHTHAWKQTQLQDSKDEDASKGGKKAPEAPKKKDLFDHISKGGSHGSDDYEAPHYEPSHGKKDMFDHISKGHKSKHHYDEDEEEESYDKPSSAPKKDMFDHINSGSKYEKKSSYYPEPEPYYGKHGDPDRAYSDDLLDGLVPDGLDKQVGV